MAPESTFCQKSTTLGTVVAATTTVDRISIWESTQGTKAVSSRRVWVASHAIVEAGIGALRVGSSSARVGAGS